VIVNEGVFVMTKILSACALVAMAAGSALAGPDFLTFEEFPVGPDTFAAAGPAQVYSLPGVASVNGGVILGIPTALPAQAFSTLPNLLGTASFGDVTLQSTISINIEAAYQGTSLQGLIFNGNVIAVSYEVRAFDSANNLLDFDVLMLPVNSSPVAVGVFGVDNSAFPGTFISLVTITPLNFGGVGNQGWDFFLDTLTFNGTIPTPGATALLGVAGLMASRRRR